MGASPRRPGRPPAGIRRSGENAKPGLLPLAVALQSREFQPQIPRREDGNALDAAEIEQGLVARASTNRPLVRLPALAVEHAPDGRAATSRFVRS